MLKSSLFMPETPGFDPSIQTEKIAFDTAAMVTCDACRRSNPPSRLKCIYCGASLTVASEAAASIKPLLRELEPWERGCNLIVRERMADPDIAGAARFLSEEPGDIAESLAAGVPVPIARVESEAEAVVVRDGLARFGIGCSIVKDSELAPERSPTRISSIEVLGDSLAVTDFNTLKRSMIDRAEFALIVPGVVTVDRVDSLEKKRRGGKTKLLDETATASDEMLLDLYTRTDVTGFRVNLTGFDFSCLGNDKGLIARENMRLLIVRLVEDLPNAKLVRDYADIRHALDHIWEIESRKDSQGLQRAGFGKVEFGSTASRTNVSQFTKYSRLQWHLL
jgi:hypothetical protein